MKQQDFFKSISDDNEDKKRLLEKDSKWARNFMCWGPKEADVIGKIERTLKWREEVSFIFGSSSKWTVQGGDEG